MNNQEITNISNLSLSNYFKMNNREIKNLGDGNEDGDAVNVKQLNEMETNVTNYVNSEIGKVNPIVSNNSDLIKAIYKNLIGKESTVLLIKELYFPDSNEGRTQNNYAYQTTDSNNGEVTFHLIFVHIATTTDAMIISLRWGGLNEYINIFVTKDIVEVSRNSLLNEPNLKIIDIPKEDKGKQFCFWIVISGETIKIMFSGLTTPISVSHHDLRDPNEEMHKIYVSDSPFTIKILIVMPTKMVENLKEVKEQSYKKSASP